MRSSFLFFGASPLTGKKGREQFSAEKNRKIYGGNRFRNIKNMAGTHFLIGIGNQIGKIGSKKGPEFGIPPEFPEFRSDFPTKQRCNFTLGMLHACT